MKKFYFRLDTPLRIKQLKEKIEKQRLSQAILKKNTEKNRLTQMKLTKKNIRNIIDENLLTSVEIRELSDYSVFATDMLVLIEAQKDVVKQANEIYERTKLDFLRCRRERQIYEKVKEHQYNEYSIMISREEQKISDELANINYSRLERNIPDENYF
ncbi:MAG: flagellar export protein FliJ [Thermoanaerobacteraceae bacterium]|nr:flagellar export protein FliJ [Thermoanaerobacteraceae bacterium]